MTKEEQRKSILKLLKEGTISLDDALDMLEASDCSDGEPIITPYQKQTYSDAIEQIVKKTVNNMNVDAVLKIMQDMDWRYGLEGTLVTREKVVECMEMNVRATLYHLVKNQIEENYPSATTGTGGFYCHAWVDSDDDDNIQVELSFQPYTAYGDGHLNTLIKLKKEENSNK